MEAGTLLASVGDQVAASAGSACHADEVSISPVLEAMDVPMENFGDSTGIPMSELFG